MLAALEMSPIMGISGHIPEATISDNFPWTFRFVASNLLKTIQVFDVSI